MLYLTIAILSIILIGMIHFYQLSNSYQKVIEEENKLYKNRIL